jgi:cyclic pyranopterin phosphate synthase
MSISVASALVASHVRPDTTLRVKIGDACGLSCTFCHNEGTPVTADNHRRAGGFVSAGPSGRVSIYAESNGARFTARPIPPDERFAEALVALRDALGYREVHLTGGEPTLHPHLPALTRIATEAGLSVAMTSNGERGAQTIPACAAAGLDRVNFSIFGTTAQELAQVQHPRFRDQARAQAKITALTRAIAACDTHQVSANANIVVLDHTHIRRVHRLLDEYSPRLSVRLLNSLDHGQASLDAIEQVLTERRAVPEAHYLTAGVSGSRTAYRLPEGRRLHVKHIRPVRLPTTCTGCPLQQSGQCQEGFYSLRLYYDQHGTYQVGVCIQRMDLTMALPEFLTSTLRHEILALRRAEYQRLTTRVAA